MLAMREKRLPFTVKNQLTGKWRIQEIRENLFTGPVHVRSLKYFQLFCFNSCPCFIKEVAGHK